MDKKKMIKIIMDNGKEYFYDSPIETILNGILDNNNNVKNELIRFGGNKKLLINPIHICSIEECEVEDIAKDLLMKKQQAK